MKHSFLHEELELLDYTPPESSPGPGEPHLISRDDLVCLCRTHALGLYRTIALVLKQEWEQFLYCEVGIEPGSDSADIDPNDYKDRFYPDTETIYCRIEKQFKDEGGFQYSRQTFHTLVHEMILSDMHRAAGNSPELVSFIKDTVKSIELLDTSTDEQKEQFWTSKFSWIQAQESLGENILLLERRRLENANIMRQWLMFFGEAEIELKTQSMRLDKYSFQIEMLEADPALSRQELDQLAAEAEELSKQQLEDLRLQVLLGPCLAKGGHGPSASPGQCTQYRKELKKILRELWLLLHPDVLQNNASYGRLTELQKEKLKELWHATMQIRPEELGYRENQIGYEYRSIAVLRDLLATAKTILEKAGIDINTRYIIQGETLDEQIDWLRNEISRLELESENVRAELKVLLEDPSIIEKSTLLSCSLEQQEKVQADMLKQAEKIKQEADAAEQTLEQLLEKGAA